MIKTHHSELYTVKSRPKWLEHRSDYEILFLSGVVLATEAEL